MKKNKGD